MRSLIIRAVASAASLVAAQDLQDQEPTQFKVYDHPVDTGSDDVWWSHNPDDGLRPQPAGYKAMWEQCGPSCSSEDCGILDSTLCFSYQFNSCYSPFFGETCCEDMYGTTCEQYYTCAYDPKGQAYCCDLENNDLETCGKALNQTLRVKSQVPLSSQLPVTTVVQYRLPPGGSGPTSEPSNSPAPQNEDESKGLPVGAIVGIATGAFAVLCLLAGALLFFIRRRKRAAKYGIMPEGTLHGPPGVGTYEEPTLQELDAKPAFRYDASEVDAVDGNKHEMPPNHHLTEMEGKERTELEAKEQSELEAKERSELEGKERKPELETTRDEMTFELDASEKAPKGPAKR